MPTVLAIGQVVFDEIILLTKDLLQGEKINSKKTLFSIGGPAALGAILLSRLSHKVFFATSLAKDKEGYEIKKTLEKEGVKLVPFFQSKTQKNIVLVNGNGNERTIIKDSTPSKPINRLDPSLIKAADLILMDRHQTGVFDQILTFKKPNAPIIFDPSTEVSSRTLRILSLVKYPILPYEALHLFDKSSFSKAIENMKKQLKKQIILTCSRFGTLLVNPTLNGLSCARSYIERTLKLFPSYKAKVKDVSGAGDVFRAAFAHALLKGNSLFQAIDFANKVAALQCQKLGTSIALPTKKETDENTLKKNKIKLTDIVKSLKFKFL